MWRSRRLNLLQNDAHFSLLGQKLWEEIHLGSWKVYFSGWEKNTSKCNKINYVPNINVNNNINCWYVVLILLHWCNNNKKKVKKLFGPKKSTSGPNGLVVRSLFRRQCATSFFLEWIVWASFPHPVTCVAQCKSCSPQFCGPHDGCCVFLDPPSQ